MPAPNPFIPGDNSFGLVPGIWYAWHLFPGYMDYPYTSTILLRDVRPVLGRKTYLELTYRDAGYGDGAQEFERRVRVLAWTRHDVACMFDREDGGHRVAVISELHEPWLRQNWPDIARKRAPDEDLQRFMNREMRES